MLTASQSLQGITRGIVAKKNRPRPVPGRGIHEAGQVSTVDILGSQILPRYQVRGNCASSSPYSVQHVSRTAHPEEHCTYSLQVLAYTGYYLAVPLVYDRRSHVKPAANIQPTNQPTNQQAYNNSTKVLKTRVGSSHHDFVPGSREEKHVGGLLDTAETNHNVGQEEEAPMCARPA